MAGIITDMSEDIKKLQQVKAEIVNIKKELNSFNVKLNSDLQNECVNQLKSLTEQYHILVAKVAEAERSMMEQSMRAAKEHQKQQQEIDNLIKKYDELLRKTQSGGGPRGGGRGLRSYTEEQITQALNSQVHSIQEAREQLKILRFAQAQVTDEQEKELGVRTKVNLKIQENTNYLRMNSDAYVQQKMNVGNYEKDIRKALDGTNMFSLSLSKMLGVIGGTAALKSLLTDAISIRGEFQKTEIAFETMLGSKKKADDLMAQMVETAAKTPFDLQGVTSGAKQLLAYGTSAENVNETLIRLGNIASGLSIPLGDLVYLYGTSMSQGRLFTQDVNQFMGRGIPLVDELSKQLGKTESEIRKMVTEGKIGFPELQKVIESMTNEGGKFYNLMEMQSKTLSGQISNLGDAWDSMLNSVGEETQGVVSMTISAASSIVENYEKVGKILLSIAAVYGTYKAALAIVTVAQDLLTARMQLAIIVSKTQMVVQSALNKVMMVNPYVLAATAVAGLVSVMWALSDNTAAAEKATRKYNEEQERFQKAIDERKQKINELIRIIQDETETEYAQIKAYEELQRLSPVLTGAYTREQLATASLTDTTKKLNEELDKINYDNIIKQIEKYKRLVNSLRNENDWNNVDLFARQEHPTGAISDALEQDKANLEKWQNNLAEYNRLKKQAEEDAKPIEVKLLEAQSSRDQIVQEYAAAKLVLEEEQRKIQESGFGIIPIDVQIRFDNAQGALLNIDNTISSLKQEQTKPETTNKKYWETKKKEAQERLDALTDIEAVGSKGAALKAKINEYDKKINAFSTNTTKQENQAEKLRQQQEKITELERKQSLERQRQQQDLENQAAQVKINALADGYEKEKAQRDLNNKMELENLERQKEDYIQKVVDMQRQVFEAEENAKAAKDNNYQKKTFDASSVSVDTSIFNKIEQDTKKKQAAETAKYYTDVLSKYQDYITKRLNAEKQFNTERERLEKSGASEAQLKELEYQRNETYNSIDKEFAMREDSFQSWADGIANLSLKKLSELLLQAERELERMEFFTPNNSKLAEQRAKVTTLKNSISNKQNKTQTTPDERSNKEWQELYKTLTEVENQFDEIGNAVGGTVGDVISSAGKITASTLQMINGIISFGEISADNIKGVSATTAQAIASVEKASVILAIIGAALQIASKIASLFKGTDYMEEFRKEMEKLNYELSLAKLNSEISADENNIFGDDLWKNAIKNVELANDALDRYNGTLDKIKNRKILSGFAGATAEAMGLKNTFNSLGASIANMQVQVQHKTWFRSTKYKSLKDAVPELFNADGTVNQKALEEFIGSDTFGKLSGENQKYLQEMSDYWKSYQDAVEKVKDYLSDIFGDLGGTLTDALVDAWANGTDAATAYYESVSEMLENLSKQMIYSAVFSDIFEKAQQKMLDVTQNTDLSADEKFAEYIKLLGSMTDEVMGKQGDFNALLEAYQKMAKEKGFDIFSPESADSAKEALESFVSDMQSALTSLDVTAKDVSDNIYDYFRQAMINALYEKEYKSKMEELYKSFEDLSADGLSESDMAQLGSQVDQYIEQMMKGVEDVNNLFADKLKDNEDLQSFVDNVKSAMSSIEATAEDVTDNIFEYIHQQMVEKMFADTFQPQIEEFYKKVQEAMSDGDITDAEKDALRNEAEKLANDIVAAKDILSDTLGITSKNLQKELEEEFKSFSDGILNSLYNAEVTAESVAKDIAESMRKELIEAMYIEQYEPRIKAIWEKWKEYSADGLVTDEERANIKADIDEIGKEVADAAKEISDAWKDSGEEVKKAFESFSDSIKSVLYGAEATAEDVANNIYQYMRNALVDSMFTAQLQPQIQAWYDKYTEFMKDGAIDTAERKTLDEMIAEIQKAGVDIVDAANALFPTLDTGAIKRAEEAAQEAENARNEAEQEWESFSDSILDSLYDIEATAEDISDDMSEYMRKALIKAMYVENFKPQMQKWYNEWQRAMGDDNLTSEEKQLLDSMKKTMVDDMKKEVDAINQFFGTMFSQQASSKGFEAMSQDTGEELNGRFTALQIAGEEIKNQSIQQTGLLSSINGKLSLLNLRSEDVPALLSGTPNFADRAKETIASGYQSQMTVIFPDTKIDALTTEVANLRGIVDEMRTFQVEGNMDRRDILENSVILAKNSPQILDNTNDIKQDIKNL